MSTSQNFAQWSVTAADNASADTGINYVEGQAPSTVNNSARALMAALAKWRLDVGGALVAGGTANALTVTTKSLLEAAHLADGLTLVVKATADNTNATVTFNPDSTGAKGIKRADGSALAIGLIKNGQYLVLVYNQNAAEWRAANIMPASTIYSPGGTDVALADGGTGASLTDPNADRILFWDDSAGAVTWLTVGTGLGITTTTMAIADAELLALAGLASAADRLPYFTGSGTAALATFTGAARNLLDDASASAMRTTLELGTAATQNTGTSGANVPLLSANNTHSGNLTVSGTFSATGAATLGDGSGDVVVIKGTTVHATSSGYLNNTSAADWRTDLGLGSLATANTINNANWSGTDLSVANGGTGASTLTGLLQGNGTSAITGGATVNNDNWSGTDLSVANGGTGQSTADAAAEAFLDALPSTTVTTLAVNDISTVYFIVGDGANGPWRRRQLTVTSGPSDYRLKSEVRSMTSVDDVIDALRPVSFVWTPSGRPGIGFIAHELAEVIPSAVHGEKDAVDENGGIIPQMVDMNQIIPSLTAEIQSLRRRVAELESHVP